MYYNNDSLIIDEECRLNVKRDFAPLNDDVVIRVKNLSKCYQVYSRPEDRLKQSIYTRFQKIIGKIPKKYYHEFWAIKDVSFEIKKGETVGIVGKNGSGKSTLLQLITGTVSPTSGSYISKGRLAALLELGSGFNPEFTGRENIFLNGAILGLSNDEIQDKLDNIVDFADIGNFIDQPVKTYSSGMYVRLAFSVQANVDPEILIVDEALSVGDAYFVHKCMLRFHDLQKKGCTIVVVSHDSSTIKRLCNRVIWLENGQIVDNGDPSKVVDDYLKSLFSINYSKLEKKQTIVTTLTHSTIKNGQKIFQYESFIPNNDVRGGDKSLEILGVQIYNSKWIVANSFQWGEKLQLRISLINRSITIGTRISSGYIVRDHRGIEIASTNLIYENIYLYSDGPDTIKTLTFSIEIPMLHSGAYSITPSVGYVAESGQIQIADRIDNAVFFEVVVSKEVVCILNFPTTIQIEE